MIVLEGSDGCAGDGEVENVANAPENVDDTLTLVDEAPISIHPDENPVADELADWKAEPIGLEGTSGTAVVAWACKARVSGTVASALVFPTSSTALEADGCINDGELVLGADTINVCKVGLIG